MPVVPRYSGGVERNALQTPRKSNNAPRDAFGVPTPNIAGEAIQNLQQIVVEHKKKADQVAVMEAENGLAALESRLLYDAKDGALTRRGKDAFELPEKVTEAWQAGTSELEAKLTSNEQRLAFANAKAQRSISLNEAVQRHVSKELQAHDDETTQAFLDNERQAALLNYDDADRVNLGVDRQLAAISDYAKRTGMSDEKREQLKLNASSKTYAGVIDRMLTNDQDLKASEYYKKVKDQISGEDQEKVEKALEEGSLRGESQRQADSIWTKNQKDPSAALDAARQIKDPKVRDATEQRIRQRIQDDRAAENERQEQLYLQATNIIDKNPNVKPSLSVPPGMWTQLSLPMRNALENRSENTDNDDQKWLTFLELSPQDVAKLNKAQFESGYWAHFDKEHRTRAEALWNAARDSVANKDASPNLHLANTITYKDRLSNTLRTAGIIPPNKSPSKFNKEEANQYAAFEQEGARAIEQFEKTQLGGKREATGEEMQQIIDNIVLKKVWVKGRYFGKYSADQKAAFGLTNDQQGRAYVPVEKIPATEQQALRNILTSRGLRVTNDRLERLFAASVIGNRTLFDSILEEK